MGRPRKKDYDAAKVMEELLASATDAYGRCSEIKAVALELGLAELKVKKLLITAGVVSYPQTQMLVALREQGKELSEMMRITGLSRASINGYLPYSKVAYKGAVVSANADRCALYRKRLREYSSSLVPGTIGNRKR